VDALAKLNVKSIRHGWQYAVMDESNINKFHMSPCDPLVQSYVSDGKCLLREKMTISEIGSLVDELNVPGFAVIDMDGIYYTGTADSNLISMSTVQREQFYIDNAIRWAKWGKENNFQYFELGNESDLPGEMVDKKVGTAWTAAAYGAYAKKLSQAIKNVYPEAKVGINGGWGATPTLRNAWWDGIRQGASDINNHIDFVVIHKYEFGANYSTWQANMWDWGRIQADNYTRIASNFPQKPVYLTETSGFKVENGVVPHYRGVMTVEMMGNALLDSNLKHMHHWGTRWGDDLVFDKDGETLNMAGKSLLAYTRFMKKRMVANGVSGRIRYFAAKDPADGSMTVWLINHATDDQAVNIRIDGFTANSTGEVWRLTSEGNNPNAIDNLLWQDGTTNASNGLFTVTTRPTSVTIISFGKP
jgi:hypothetical protein